MKKNICIVVLLIVVFFLLGIVFARFYLLNDNVKENNIIQKNDEVLKEDENMTQLKKLYKEILEKYNVDEDMYVVADIEKDNIPELIIRTGNSEADYIFNIYKYIDGNVEAIGNIGAGHINLYYMNNEKYLKSVYAHMGYEMVSELYIENNLVTVKEISTREVAEDEEYEKGDKLLELYKINDTSLIDSL